MRWEISFFVMIYVLLFTQYSKRILARRTWSAENEILYLREVCPQCEHVFSIVLPVTMTPVEIPVTSWESHLIRGSFASRSSFGPKKGSRIHSRKLASKWISSSDGLAMTKTLFWGSKCIIYPSMRRVSIIVASVSGVFAVSIRCEDYFEINFDHSETRRFLRPFS